MINVIKASAGSGKTYQLTYEYIKLLLGVKRKGHYELAHEKDRERHRHILAVTFTNKATGEMKERIVKELAVLAGKIPGKESPYLNNLCRDLGDATPEDVKSAAYRALVDLLFDYTNFNVSTIDSFFQMILRTFARELKMSYNYDIEIDDKYAINVGINDFLSGLTHDRHITTDKKEEKRVRRVKSWIKEFVKNEVTGGKTSWNIFSASEESSATGSFKKQQPDISLGKFTEELQKEELRQYLDALVDYLGYDEDAEGSVDSIATFKGWLYERMKVLKTEASGAALQIVNIGEAGGWSFDYVKPKWLKDIYQNSDAFIETKADSVEKCLDSPFKKLYSTSKQKKVAPLNETAEEQIYNLLETILKCKRQYTILKDLHRNVFLLGMLGEINRYMSKFRKENDLILLGDTNELLHRIINKEETPFVYERVGIWLSHFLIDEFQDTSRSQWDNMKPLLFNSCAEGSDNLIIGDEKQCIYRFRNADPSLLRTDVSRHFTVQQTDGARSINWRSTPTVIAFNNTFFPAIADMLGTQEEYANVQQDTVPQKKYLNEGYVEVNVISGADKQQNNDTEIVKVSFKDMVLERLPELIKDIVSRGYNYSDIAILVNQNSEGAEVVNHILHYNNFREECEPVINVVSNESLMLKSSSAVRLIVSHLRYLDTKMPSRETNDESVTRKDKSDYLHRILREYETLMFKHGLAPGEALEKSLATVPEVVNNEEATAASLMSLLPENTESFNIVSITEHIIAHNLSEEDLLSENAFIQAFQDCVVDFSNRPNATIHEFLHWWDKGGCNTSVNSPDGQNAINVLTIHKSKGLEFKCVILPFCDWDLVGKNELLWIPRETLFKGELLNGISPEYVPPVIPLMPNSEMGLDNTSLHEFWQEKLRSRKIDGLNKTYVAFTRAVDEMYIFTQQAKTDKNGNISNDTQMSVLLATLPFDEDGKYITGTKGHVTRQDNAPTFPQKKMPLYRVNDIKMEYTTPDVFGNEQRVRGTRLHNVFKRIRYKEDADTALRYFRAHGVITSENYEEDRRIVMEALEDHRVQEWFAHDNRVYNERNMVKQLEKSRPDRFIVTPDGRTIVIDYKFGDHHYKSYKKQVKDYMNILAETGFTNIEGYIWYPLEKIIEPVK